MRISTLLFCLLFLFLISPQTAFSTSYSLPVNQATETINVLDGDLIYDDGGQAGNYSSVYMGALILIPPLGQVIRLEFLSLDLESGFDFVVVYDGPGTRYPLALCETSGNSLPGSLAGSRSSGMAIMLTSDGFTELAGFEIRVTLLPAGIQPPDDDISINFIGHDTLSTCTGFLFDHGGATCNTLNNAGYQLDQNFNATPTGFTTLVPDIPNHVIRLEFLDFDFEQIATSGMPDALNVFDGGSDASPLIGTFNTSPGTLVADNGLIPNADGSLTLWMESDFIIAETGFRARITCVQRPEALLSGSQTICNGETATLTVDLTGSPPFNFTYSENGQSVSVTAWNANQYTFNVTPGIGDHTYEMVSIADANLTQLRPVVAPSSATVTVLAGPTANFARPQYTTCGGNPVKIEINLTGTAPFDFSYTDGAQTFDVVGHPNSRYEFTITPASSQMFQLLSVSDAQCSVGRIVQQNVLVQVSPAPTAILMGASASGVCPGGTANLSVLFTGSGPWDLVYSDGTQNKTINAIINSPLLIPVTPLQLTNYNLVSVNTANCPPGQVSGQVQMLIFPTPNLVVTPSVSCSDGTGTLLAEASNGASPYIYSFDNGVTWGPQNKVQRTPRLTPYLVSARDANGCQKTVSVALDGIPPPRITDILLITENSMRVFWTAVSGNGVQYELRYKVVGVTMPWTVISYNLRNFRPVGALQSGTIYEFQVKAICGNNLESNWSDPVEAKTLEGQPADCALATRAPYPMPGGFYVDQITANSVRMNWNSVGGPGYIVSWGLFNINSNNWPQDVVCNVVPMTKQSTYIIRGLTPGITYRARVRTNCSNCTTALQSVDIRSNWTASVEFTTLSFREASTSEVQSDQLTTLNLYPNPNNGIFVVSGFETENSCKGWKLLDLSGRIVQTSGTTSEFQPIQNQEIHLDCSQQPPGMYVLVIDKGGILGRFKVWIQ